VANQTLYVNNISHRFSVPAFHITMAPSASVEEPVPVSTKFPKPLKLSGAIKEYEQFDPTPIMGREFPKANLVDWLNAPNADDLIRDLAITS
jgi:hypothetical protein